MCVRLWLLLWLQLRPWLWLRRGCHVVLCADWFRQLPCPLSSPQCGLRYGLGAPLVPKGCKGDIQEGAAVQLAVTHSALHACVRGTNAEGLSLVEALKVVYKDCAFECCIHAPINVLLMYINVLIKRLWACPCGNMCMEACVMSDDVLTPLTYEWVLYEGTNFLSTCHDNARRHVFITTKGSFVNQK